LLGQLELIAKPSADDLAIDVGSDDATSLSVCSVIRASSINF